VISYPAVASMVGVVSHEQLKHTVFLQSAWLCIPQEVLAIPNIWDNDHYPSLQLCAS